MLYPSYHSPSLIDILKGPIAIKALCLWFGFLVFFFSPEIVHAEFLDRLELVNHLRQGHYSKLEKILAHQESLYQKNKIPEEHVEAAYFAFSNSAVDLENKLNEWVARENTYGTALLARGIYYWNIGWLARGGAFMSETPNQRVSTMKDWFALAWQDLNLSTKYKPTSGVPYRFLISIAMSLGDHEGIDQQTQTGLQADPGSFTVRWQYLYSLTPWWSSSSTGKSIHAVEKFLQEKVTPDIQRYPRLKPLLGFPDFVRAEMFERNNNEQSAIPFYQQALQQGEYFYMTYQYAEVLNDLGQYEQALNIINQALSQRPQVADVLDEKARILANLKHPKKALQIQAESLQFNELDPDLLETYAWRLQKQGQIEEAKEAVIDALIYGSYDHGVQGDLGRLYLADLNNPAKALPHLKKAVRLKPKKSWYWLNYGWALHKLENCQGVEALQHYNNQCMVMGSCDPENMEWAKKTSQRMIWKEGCWREHPALRIIQRLAKWLPKL